MTLTLHATQSALFLVVPRILEAGGLPVASNRKVYLPVMGLSFVMMVPAIIAAEKRGKMKIVLLSAIALILIGQLLLGVAPHTILSVAAILFVYFLGFNILGASHDRPAPASRLDFCPDVAPRRSADAPCSLPTMKLTKRKNDCWRHTHCAGRACYRRASPHGRSQQASVSALTTTN
ncbi:hypothetical protein QF000_000256 [Paraburkholderia atlantica]|uniref:MFS transporter n=1 Tax=Paraburkholderia youngii TaxID=2782701 RepID=A0A7W8P682_9BURK|nr:hypothetical protein [Paraburkholderia youngii]